MSWHESRWLAVRTILTNFASYAGNNRAKTLVFVFVVALLFLQNVPAHYAEHDDWECPVSGSGEYHCKEFEHGWPFCFLCRDEYRLGTSIWPTPSEVREFYPAALFYDFCVGSFVVVVTTWLLFRFRSPRFRAFSFSLSSSFAFCASVVDGKHEPRSRCG
jgi:hypothetical protein